MREILFRGISEVTDEWVYGYLVKTRIGGNEYFSIVPYDDLAKTLAEKRWFQVIPETVGQYTGLTDKKGYFLVDLYKNNKRHQRLVHRLVSEAFIKNPDNLPCVNHKDENKANNRLDNLEWCTQKYNMNYGSCPERIGRANSKGVIQFDKEGNIVGKYSSIICAERMVKISQGSIGDCLHGRRKTAGGYLWQYEK